MEEDFDLTRERECFSCFYDLHMSVVCCKCSMDEFVCLKHATLLFSCGKDDRCGLVRYTMDELNTLTEALAEKLVPLEAWALAYQKNKHKKDTVVQGVTESVTRIVEERRF